MLYTGCTSREKPEHLENRELYFVFMRGRKHIFEPFCKKGFSHVYVCEKLEFLWIVYNPTRYGLEMYMPAASNDDLMARIFSNEDVTHIVRAKCRPASYNLLAPPQLLTCVTNVGYISGIRFGWRVQTPYALFKLLVAGEHNDIIESRELNNVYRSTRCKKSEKTG